jgi:hypothetical protein
MIDDDDDECGAVGGMKIGRGNEMTKKIKIGYDYHAQGVGTQIVSTPKLRGLCVICGKQEVSNYEVRDEQ